MSYAWTEVLELETFATTIIQDDMYDTYQTFRTIQRSRNEYENVNYEDEDDQVLDLYGEVEELATIELSVIPATVKIDNDYFDGETRVIIEGANRLGTLVEITQCVTEMNLNIKSAHICSDDGWCFDELRIVDPSSSVGKVTDVRKLDILKQMLNPKADVDVTDLLQGPQKGHTVLELSGPDRPGLLSEVTEALESSGFKLCSVAVWTQPLLGIKCPLEPGQTHVAFVLSVMDEPAQLRRRSSTESVKQQCGEQLRCIMRKGHDGRLHAESTIVEILPVDGPIHHDRRLHRLLHAEESKSWTNEKNVTIKAAKTKFDEANELARQEGRPVRPDREFEPFPKSFYAPPVPPPGELPADGSPYVYVETVNRNPALQLEAEKDAVQYQEQKEKEKRGLEPYYWHLHLRCKDRTKLLLDVASTLADMNFDVRHAEIETKPAAQGSGYLMSEHTYLMLPKEGSIRAKEPYDERKVDLARMVRGAVTRRFPQGQKIKVKSRTDSLGAPLGLGKVASALKNARLNIARAHALPYETQSTHTFVVTREDGTRPAEEEVTAVFKKELHSEISGEGNSHSPFTFFLEG